MLDTRNTTVMFLPSWERNSKRETDTLSRFYEDDKHGELDEVGGNGRIREGVCKWLTFELRPEAWEWVRLLKYRRKSAPGSGSSESEDKSSGGKEFGVWEGGQSLVNRSEKSRICGCRGRAELVGLGKQSGFYSESNDQTVKGFKQGGNMIRFMFWN